MTPVAILIPGIMGSELSHDGEKIWPGSIGEWFGGYGRMDQLLSDGLEPTGVIREYTFFYPQYKSIISDLKRCRFEETAEPPTLVPFPYDWRRSNKDSANRLADVIDISHDQHRGNAEFTLIAHSMGGLIARYYLESNLYRQRSGFARIRRLITLGTPHRGAPLALPRLLGKERVLWLSASQVRTALKDPRYPSAYELLPPCQEPFVWDDSSGSEFTMVNLYDMSVAQRLGLEWEGLMAAQDFHSKLDHTRRPEQVRYFCFAGTRLPTAANIRCRPNQAQADLMIVNKDDLLGGGDGVVPFWSSTLSGVQNLAVGGEHSVIYKDRDLLRTLATILGHRGVLAGEVGLVDVAIREPVVGPREEIYVTLGFDNPTSTIRGELLLEQADVDPATGTVKGHTPKGKPVRISYDGAAVKTLAVLFDAPGSSGLYRLAFQEQGRTSASGAGEFVVQATSTGPA